jgi:hypothetical protein
MAGTTTSAAAVSRDRGAKRPRPPNLALETAAPRRHPLLQLDSSLLDNCDLPSAPPSSTSPSSPIDPNFEPPSDEFIKDLAALEKLRQNVHKNLRLRPINASTLIRNNSPRSPVDLHSRSSPSWYDIKRDDIASPTSTVSSTASVYFTPPSDAPLSAYFGFASKSEFRSLTPENINSPTHEHRPRPLHHSSLHALLSRSPHPLLIDTRPINAFMLSHLAHSVNVTIPSLILKRCRKPGAGFHSIDALRQYITTDRGKQIWDNTIHGDIWDGNFLIFDEEMDEKLRNNMQSTAWGLLHAVPSLLLNGRVDYLQGGLSTARRDLSLQHLFVSGDSPTPLDQHQFQLKTTGGLFQLDTSIAVRSKQFPQIEYNTDPPSLTTSSSNKTPPSRSWVVDIMDSQSPPPQSIIPPHKPTRRPSAPSLRKIDTQAVERLPKLSLKTQFSKSATHATGPPMPWHGKEPSPLHVAPHPPSTSYLHLDFPSLPQVPPPPMGSTHMLPEIEGSGHGFLPVSPTHAQPPSQSSHTPLPLSPLTARQEDNDPPSTEEPFPVFTISTILPNFLFLGPELTLEEHVKELQEFGVKRILNIAAECDDDQGLSLRQRFESYVKIPMRDTVEEENIRRGVREVCDILGEECCALHFRL